ncbi:MAG: hypothetical protein MZV65_21270 [Chromatiales bacterium]|nr:hypothetical protein [Chromatiales bacterium]
MELQARDEWGGDVYDILPLDRRHSECDVLVWEGQTITEAVEELSPTVPFPAQAALSPTSCFSVWRYRSPQDLRCRDLLPLYRAVEASGVRLLVATDAVAGAGTLKGALVELAHQPIPARPGARQGGFRSGVLIAEESLIAKSRIGSRIKTVARMLQRPEQAARPIEFDSDTAGFLSLPKQRLEARRSGQADREAAAPSCSICFGRGASRCRRSYHPATGEGRRSAGRAAIPAGGASVRRGERAPRDLQPLEEEKPYEVLAVFVGEQDPR